MDQRARRISLTLGITALLGLAPGLARAQFPVFTGAGGSSPTVSNSVATPTGAPFMNTMAAMAMSQSSVDPGTSALYFMSTAQPGSMMSMGRINQNRQMGGAQGGAAHPATAAHKNSANVPGALASRYFNRTTVTNPTTDHFYKRQARQYPTYSQSR
jgi:hypothetical protein